MFLFSNSHLLICFVKNCEHAPKDSFRAAKDKVEIQQILSTQFGITVFVYVLLGGVQDLVLCKQRQHENSRHVMFIVFSCFFPRL
jgi:hypothetical protein